MGKPNLSIIRELAKKQNVSLKYISEQLNISPAALQNIMRNNGTSLETIGKLAEILDVSVGVFFGEENKSKDILAILNKAFADDIKRTDDIVQAIDRAKVVFEDMKINDNPELQKKFVNYQQEQYTKALDNQYLFVLMKLNTEDLKKLVTLDYISKDVFTLIELLKRFAKNPIVKEMAKKSIKNALKGGLDDTALD